MRIAALPRLLPLSIVAAALALAAPAATQGTAPRLALPIACMPGTDCFVQNGFDHDPGPAAKDHRCTSATYDGHDGIDIRVPTRIAMRRGVSMLASAAGTVKAVRAGEAERALGDGERPVGRECGNGVLLSHPGGWETQYCHMATGSVRVRPGQTLAAGEPLGRVGLSGWTQFPHAHLTVRHNGKAVDPFTGGAAACNVRGVPLWTPTATAALAASGPQVINSGFADRAVTAEEVEEGGIARPTRTSPGLTAYARVIGLEAGDVMTVALIGPDGGEMARTATPSLDRAKAQYMLVVGKRLRTAAWPGGRYRLRATVTRGGRTVTTGAAELTLR